MNIPFLVGGALAIIFAGGQLLIYNRSTSNFIQTISIISAIIGFIAGFGLLLLGLIK